MLLNFALHYVHIRAQATVDKLHEIQAIFVLLGEKITWICPSATILYTMTRSLLDHTWMRMATR